jgi:hypothetical protein
MLQLQTRLTSSMQVSISVLERCYQNSKLPPENAHDCTFVARTSYHSLNFILVMRYLGP